MAGAGIARARCAALAALLALSTGGAAHADEATRARAEASCARAEGAARERRFADALAAYREAMLADPSAPCASAARARVEDLEAHAEGAFGPLARLEEVRRDPVKGRDRAAIEALERDLASFPPGRVQAEARIFVADAWWHALGEPARAVALLEDAAAEREADKLTRSLALSELAALRRERGELAEALQAAERDPTLSPTLVRELHRLVRRERIRWAATALLGALAAVGLGSVARLALRARDVRTVPARLVRPAAVAFALYVGGASAFLVRMHGDADARPFLWLGLAVLGLDVTARAFRPVAGRLRATRALWALACVAGLFSAAFLAVERTEAEFLAGIGL